MARVEAPTAVAPGEGFLITAWVQSPTEGNVSYELTRGDKVIAGGEQRVTAGLNRLTFRDRAADSGTQSYSVRVRAPAIGARPLNRGIAPNLPMSLPNQGIVTTITALPALVAALRPTQTRADAAASLAKFGSKAVPFLVPLLSDSQDENIRFHVREALTLAGWRPRRTSPIHS